MSIHGGLVGAHQELERNSSTGVEVPTWLVQNMGGVLLVGMTLLLCVGFITL